MRRILFTSSFATAAIAATALAHAADLGPMVPNVQYAPVPPAPVYYNWTGFYLGANVGGSRGRESHEIFDVLQASFRSGSRTNRRA
jgi:hypothetical protein